MYIYNTDIYIPKYISICTYIHFSRVSFVLIVCTQFSKS